MKIIFMGTPQIAVPALETLIDSEYELIAVVTQPDAPKGRHKTPVPSPVKTAAAASRIRVLQPEKARDPEFISEISALKPDFICVMAYGQILPKELLDIPKYGCINVHTSLLPMYRGASPISACILAGEKETGVTTMLMDEGLDTGDILLSQKVAIEKKETTQSLENKLSEISGKLLYDTIRRLAAGEIKGVKQEGKTCYAGMIKKEEGLIDWSNDAASIERKIRAYYPWPGAYTLYKGQRVKIFDADVSNESGVTCRAGEILCADKTLAVCCGKGTLTINELQAEGKKRMKAADFLRGVHIMAGETLGGEN